MSSDTLHDRLQASLGASYTIHRELEGGAMARVFVAHERRLGRDVVVKVLSPQLAGGLSVERFAREIRLAAQLQEPHIVPLLAAGETEDGLPFYTMPYVVSDSLQRRLAEGPLPREEALKVLTDVARALAYAHDRGVVHRDIKPANVLLSSGTAVVTDFGIAKALSASRVSAGVPADGGAPGEDAAPTMATHHAAVALQTTGFTATGTGASLGTPAYMAPEQSVGDEVGPSADVYAWGVMAYELLAGAHPFAECKTAPQLLAAHLAKLPAPLSQRAARLPRAVAALVTRCLAKLPAQRPQDGAELLASLARATAERAPSRKERAAMLTTVAAAVVALVLGGESFLRARSAEAAAPPLVAVLPFESAGQVLDTTFAGVLEDAVTGKLARLAALRVIDRASVIAVQKVARNPQQVGRELGADYVLRATVRWVPGTSGAPRAVVSPSLVRVKDGVTKWAGEPQRVTLADPFAVQATLATRVVEALDVALATRERDALRSLPTQDTAAFAAYTRGMALREQAAASGHSAPLQLRALHEFERAYRLDPKYPAPYAAAARTLWSLSWAGATPQVRADSVDALTARALALDSLLPQAIEMRATLAFWRDDWRTGKALLERAARAAPSDLKLLTLLANEYMYAGEVDSAWVATARSLRLAPRNPEVLGNAGFVATALQRFDQAERWYRQLLALEPERADRWGNLAYVAGSRGDTTLMNEALRESRARGGRVAVRTIADMFAGGSALVREARAATLESLGASTEVDTMLFYMNKAEDRLLVGDVTSARAFVDSGLPIARRRARIPQATVGVGRQRQGVLAWFLAAAGDSAGALAALRRFMDDPEVRARPRGDSAADVAGVAAQVYGLVGDVDAMLPQLARAITPPGSFTPALMRRDAAIARHLGDPRVRALLR